MGFACLALGQTVVGQTTVPRLQIHAPETSDGWVRFDSTVHSNALLALQVTTNLAPGGWQTIGILHDAVLAYPDAGAPSFNRRFYRLLKTSRGANDDWKNQIHAPDIFGLTIDNQSVGWVKFAILLNDPTRVYYQDSRKYRFHYDFAAQRLAPFQGMDRATFDAISLYRTNQQVVLGAVLFPPGTNTSEYGVQFVGLEAYSPAEIGRWFELVRATVAAQPDTAAFYMPTFEQSDVARTNADAFAALGIQVASAERWVTLNSCYSAGWAFGRLKYFAAADITAAYADGRLRPEDILLTDGVPADTPPMAGIISLSPSTPNSHTAILSQSFGVPFVYLPDAAERERVQGMDGHKVILFASVNAGVARISVVDVEGTLDPGLEAELTALKRPQPIAYMPKKTLNALWSTTDTLVPSDIQYFGGKSANFGFLRRCVPTNSPVAIAFSFDLWDAFLDQALPGGGTLRSEIASRLAPYTNYPPDIVSLKTNLAAIRDLFTKTASFTVAQQQVITNALGLYFNPRRNVRFRSSTNVEDSEHFTGAGLYDSYSGCLMDDLDGDTAGPCQCDPAETKERGVFRAIQKVYASFYNDDAFLERLAHAVDETKVGMGVLVHHSFPDEDELANGVATPRFTFSAGATNFTGDMVTQLGAVSVTNPDGSSVPEVVGISGSVTSPILSFKQSSSLVPLGAPLMSWGEYMKFLHLFQAVAGGFREYYPKKTNVWLDFEYKKDANLGLVIKQVRELPQAVATNFPSAILLDMPVIYTIRQGEGGNVFAYHRLKSVWNLHTVSCLLTPTNLARGIYAQGRLDYAADGSIQALTGALNSWPNASNSPSGTFNYWTTGAGAGQRTWRLETDIVTNVPGSTVPFITQADFSKSVTVTYATPMPAYFLGSGPGMTTQEQATLEVCPNGVSDAILQARTMASGNLTMQTSYYWPKPPRDQIVIWTAPLLQFKETLITGLTTDPIVLRNYYSQTYSPHHHNFGEEFVFEPRLEPGLSPDTLAQLQAANIQLIFAYYDYGAASVIYALGFDQVWRRL